MKINVTKSKVTSISPQCKIRVKVESELKTLLLAVGNF